MLGKGADIIAHDHIAHAVGSCVFFGRKAHELRPDMNSALSINTTQKRLWHNVLSAQKTSEAALSPSKDQKMTFPEWTKPSIYGALGGAIAVSILGFTWGGWITSGNAQTMAKNFATDEVTLAMVPVCLDSSAVDPERIEKLAILQELSGFGRRNAMMETGWAIRPGSDSPDRDLADACLAGLELDGS